MDRGDAVEDAVFRVKLSGVLSAVAGEGEVLDGIGDVLQRCLSVSEIRRQEFAECGSEEFYLGHDVPPVYFLRGCFWKNTS